MHVIYFLNLVVIWLKIWHFMHIKVCPVYSVTLIITFPLFLMDLYWWITFELTWESIVSEWVEHFIHRFRPTRTHRSETRLTLHIFKAGKKKKKKKLGDTFHIPLTKSATLNRLSDCSLWRFSGALLYNFLEGSFFAFLGWNNPEPPPPPPPRVSFPLI